MQEGEERLRRERERVAREVDRWLDREMREMHGDKKAEKENELLALAPETSGSSRPR